MKTKFNKSDFLLLASYFLVSISLGVYQYYQDDAYLQEYFIDFPLQIVNTLILIYLFMVWLIPEYFIKRKKYFHFVFFGLLIMISVGVLQRYIGFWSGKNDWNKFPSFTVLILDAISGTAEMIGLPFALLLTKKFYEGQTKMIGIEKQQKENELKLLRSQLDPHFLFNNLNTLDALIDTHPEKAKEYINRLSLIYRYLIKTKDAEVMELSEELDLTNNYIFLIKTRFGNDYDFKITKNTSIENKFIPTGALQTLLENVVKHNKAQNGIQIKTTILIGDDWLVITNTKSKGITNETLGTGLENLKSRYHLLSDKNILIEDKENTYKIAIPIIKLIKED
jgi:sensor histidine kinase YesM